MFLGLCITSESHATRAIGTIEVECVCSKPADHQQEKRRNHGRPSSVDWVKGKSETIQQKIKND
jgi:hypothetical protein